MGSSFGKSLSMLALGVLLSACNGAADGKKPKAVSPQDAWYARLDEADASPDAMERCRGYGDPPGYAWSPALVHALCADRWQPGNAPAVLRFIEAGDLKALHAHFDGYLRRHYARTAPELMLYRAFPKASWASAEQADAYSRRWLDAVPADPYANTLRARTLLDQAWQVRGVEFAKDVPSERMQQAVALAIEASQLAQRAIEREPRLLPAYEVLLRTAALTGNRKQFSDALSAALQQSPDSYYIRDTAMELLEPKWGGSVEEMDRLSEEAQIHLASNPRLALLRVQRIAFDGRGYSRNKQYGPALDVYRRALALGPELSVAGMAAVDAVRSDRHADAIVFLSQTIRFSRAPKWDLVSRGIAWEAMGEFQRAMRDYGEAEKLAPDDATIPLRMGALEHKRQHFPAAERHYLRTLELDPANTQAMRNACRLWVHLTLEPRKALPYAKRLTELRADDPESWLLLANVQHGLGDPATQETARRFLELAPPEDPRWKDSVEVIKRYLGVDG